MSEPNAFEKFMNWASSNPLVQGAANFLSDPIGNVKNIGYDIKSTFGGYDPREAHFTITDDNGTEHEYDFGSGGYIYKTPSGEHTSHRGYAYLNVGNDGRLKLNVSKSVAESDWFKTQFTENDTFKKVIKMFNANPASNTTLTTTDKDGNVKNVTLAEALKQYNDALGEYASNYEGISYLRDYYKNNTGLTLTDDQIRISESTINRDEDSKNESKVIYIPDSWNAIYDFKQLPSWNGDTKTVSAKDFFDVYNLDEKGSITEEQWNALSDAAEAELENAFSGRVAKNLNTEDPEAIKSAGDKLAKAVAASKTINGSKPDVSGVHATGIFLSSLGEQFTSSLSNTYGNIGEFIVAQGEWLANSPVAPISWTGERIEDVVFLSNTPANSVLAAMGAIGEDIANGRIAPDTASDYVAEIRDSLEELWSSTHGDMSYKEYHNPIFGGHSINEITETFDKDISYMEKISKAAAGGKFVGNLLELGVEVWATEATGTAVGKAIETTGMNIGRGLGLAFKGSKIKDQASIVTKLYMAANKATAFTGNMMVQGFMDTVESDAGTLMAKLLSSGELSEQEKQELTTAMTANTLYNIGGEMVVGKLVPKFLETKPGRFVQTRAQKAIAAASLPFKKGQIGFAKLINGVVNGKTPTKAMEDIAQKYAFSFGVNSLNEYNVKLAEANYEATKSIATAKEGKEYIDAITGNKLKASSTTQAIETAVMNKMYYQNMVDRISKGFRAEVNEIMNTPDIAKAKTSAEKANASVLVAEKSAGKKPVTFETGNGAQVVAKAQDDANYLIYKNRLEVMNNKEAALKAAKKTLSTSDEEFKSALENAVRGFEATNDPRLVAALNEYYLANLSLNKALTDWEVKHGLISEETYESLRKTGFFGPDDELYMKTMRINKNGPNVTDDYMAAVSNYANSYYKTMQESYRVNPVYDTDQHIARFFDPEANYIDPLLASNARIGAMALAYQANNWGKALKGIGMPMEEMDTLGKATSHKEVAEAMSSAKKAAATAIGNLQVDEFQLSLSGKDIDEFVTLGKSEYEGYNLEERIKDTEGRLARKLGIADNDQVSRNVKMLSDEQIVSTIDAIPESPAYGAVKNYDEFTAMQDSIPTKEMKAKAEKMMNTQISEYDKGFKAKTKEFEAQKKERLAQATTLEKEASDIDKEVARIEKANASGQAKYEKAKAGAEKKIKAAEEKAKKAAAKAQKAGGAEAAEKQLMKDARDAVLYNDEVDFTNWEKDYTTDDVLKELSEERRKEVRNILKDGFEKEQLMSLDKIKPEDVLDPEYIESVRAKYIDPDYLENAKAEASVTGLKEKIVGEGKDSRKVKEVPIANGKYSIDYDASIADGIDGLINDKGFSIKGAESGIANDYPNKNRLLFGRGEGHIEFDDVNDLKKSQINKIKKSAEKAGLEFKAEYWKSKFDGKEKLLSLEVTQNTTIDGTSATTVYKEAKKNAVKKFGGKASDANDIFGFEKSLGDGKKIDDFRNFLNDEHRKLVDEHGGFFTNQDLKKERWDEFFKNMGVDVSSKRATPDVESIVESSAKAVPTPEVKMPDPFVPTDTADKVAEAAAKREEAARIRGEVDSLKAPRSISDKQKTVKAWNDAVKKTDMVKDLNKMWLQDAITNKGIEIPEGVMAYVKDQIANAKLAEHTEIDLIDSLVMRSKNPAKTAESIEKWLDEYNKLDEDLQKMKELLKLQGEGMDPFTRASENILDTITEKTGKILSGNPASKRILEMAKEQGVDTDLVKEYLSINALLRENGNGDLVLRDDVQKAIKERLLKEMRVQKGNEGNLTAGMQEKVIKDFQGIAQETAKSKWAIAQEKLISAGGNDFVDVEKSFKQVEKEMETFVGKFHSDNVVPMMNANGELKYYKVSPLVADIYMNRPIASYGKLSNWFNNMSKISRVSKTTLNATSVINQCFRDPLNAYIGAGMYKGFRAYEKEMAEIFGPELVAQLQDSMSKAGWDAFTEGGKISGSELQRKAARYVVEDSGVNTFAKETTENALFESRRTALRGARMGALDNLDVWNKHYKKAKFSLNEFADKFQKVAGAPGYIINESRELFLRKADYASAFNTALRQGKTMLEAKNIAEFVSRHATTNFGRTFMWGNSIVNATPFLGAAINGSASFWRLVAMDPVGVFSRFVTAGMATMSIIAQSMTTKRDRDVYKTIPEWMKQENIVFVYDGEVFKIPIPQEMGALLAPFRQAVEKTNPGVQSHAWLELLCNDMLELSPISLDGFETLDEVNLDSDPTFFDRMSRESSALIAQIAPPLLKTAYMAQVGVDPYTGNPIDTSYKWVDGDGNIQIMDNTQSSFANFISDKLDWFGEKKSTSFWYKTMDSFFGTGLMNIADGVTNIFSGDVVGGIAGFAGTQLEKGLNAVNVRDYQLQDPYLREFKATIKELEEEKNKLLAPDGELALLSQKMSMLSPTDAKYDELKKRYIQQYNQITEDYRQRVLSTVQNYNNNYGSTYTINQFASITNLLVFQESTLMPLNAYQDEQLSQMYYSSREQAYQTMIDMGFDSPDDWSIFGVARRNKETGEVYIKYASPTAILNMDNVAMGAGRVYSAELESVLKNAGLTKSERIRRYAEAKAKGKNAVKAFKQEWNAEVAQAIADTMYKYGASNVINSGDATSLLNKYFYISNTSYKVKDYLEDVFGKED